MADNAGLNPEPFGRVFATTHWSVVLRAKNGEAEGAGEAMERLCHTYWAPLYAYIRRQGYNPEDAQDLTQEFLSRLVHKEWLSHLQDQRGKFRSFLLTFLKHFLSDQRDWANAKKRGGGQSTVPLDAYREEERSTLNVVDDLTAEQIYEKRWACAVMAQAASRLREEYVERGKADLFDQLKDLQPGEHGEQNYARVGLAFNMTEQAMKSAVHRLRRRHRELLREEIAQTVSDPAEVDEEIRHLMRVFVR